MSAASESRAEAVSSPACSDSMIPTRSPSSTRSPPSELRDYRDAVTDLLYDDDTALLQRTAEAARLLPARTLATIGEHTLGPLICARLTGLLDPHRAVEISRHFTIEFLARLSAELDPRRAVDVVTAMPGERVLEIAIAMAATGEHVAMGRFVAHLDELDARGCIEKLSDEDDLRVAFVTEGKQRLPEIFELVGTGRTKRILDQAKSNGLGQEALDLRDHLSARQRSQLPHAGGTNRPS